MHCSGKIQIGIYEFRKDFAWFWANPKTDRESLKSTLWVDSLDQLQIRIFEIHLLSIYFRRERIENSIFDKRFSEPAKTGYWQQMRYMYDIKTEPMLVTPFFINISYDYHFCEEHEGVTLSWQWSFIRIFRFFCSKEFIWSEITNPFLNSSKKRTPRRFSQERKFSLMNRKGHVSLIRSKTMPFNIRR